MSSVTDYTPPTKTVSDDGLVRVMGDIGGANWEGVTPKEIIIGESLLNPSVMISITFQTLIYSETKKNLLDLKGKSLSLDLHDNLGNSMTVGDGFKIYRVDNRAMMPINLGRTEEFAVHAIHETTLTDAQKIMSKSWKCTTPDAVVRAAFECIKAEQPDVQKAEPARDYIAEMIHPYQVIQQQANVALDGDDPSFIHWMTLNKQGDGIHHFKSLKSLFKENSDNNRFTFNANEVGTLTNSDYNNPANRRKIIVFEFPCVFDYLTDLLNGVGANGQNLNAIVTSNPMGMGGDFISGMGGASQINPCIDAANIKQSMTNKGSSQEDYGCPMDVEKHLLKRQARMALLDRDKIAFRFTTVWHPEIHAGDVIDFEWQDLQGNDMPDNAKFLVTSLTHKIQFGGFSTTSYDCIRTDIK